MKKYDGGEKLVELIRSGTLPSALKALAGIANFVRPRDFRLESNEEVIVILTYVKRAVDAVSENVQKEIDARKKLS